MILVQPTFYFDTNVYRRLARENRRIPAAIKRIALSFITSLELIEQLQRSSAMNFNEIKRAVSLASKHGRKKFLHSPDQFVQWKLFNQGPDLSYLNHSKKGLEIALRIRSCDRVSSPVHMINRKYKLLDFIQPRRILQDQWICLIRRFRDDALRHASLPSQSAGPVITGDDAKDLTAFVRSPEWRESYARSVIPHADSTDLDTALLIRVMHALDAAATFLGEMVRATIVDGYQFKKKANDSFDHLQLQYLCADEMVFVTDDGPLVERIKNSKQRGRVISLGQFLEGKY